MEFDRIFSNCVRGLVSSRSLRRDEIRGALMNVNANLRRLADAPEALESYRASILPDLQRLYSELTSF